MRHQLLYSDAISASGNVTSTEAQLEDGLNEHGLQYEVTGDGTCQIEVFTSIEGSNYVSNGVVASSVTKTSGPGSDGKDIIPLRLKPGDLLRAKVAETGGSKSVTVSLWLVQK